MSNLTSILSKTIASAIVTAAALSGNVMAAGCAGATCNAKQNMSKCGACKPKCAASNAHKIKKKKSISKCGACKAKCSAKADCSATK